MSKYFKTVGIAGAGTMGIGIAQVAAIGGSDVLLFDLSSEALDKARNSIESNINKGIEKGKIEKGSGAGILSRIQFLSDLEELKADLIIEAITEKVNAKIELFRKLEKINSAETVFASNTSSIPITQIAGGVSNPSRVVGIHFFNPAHIMKLVEIISGIGTDPLLADRCYQWIKSLGKSPVMSKDSPGFIVNRVARHFYTESLKAIEERAASFEQVDRLMEASGFRMGPFRLMDLIGVDTNHSVTCSMYEQFYHEPRFRPSRLQRQYVDSGRLGKKNGKGFYEYD